MTETLRYLEHHVKRAEFWDVDRMTSEEVAKMRVGMWNNPISIEPKIIYPETPEFINALVRLIEAHRNGEHIEVLDDYQADIYQDPMCRACKQCSNPSWERQYRLPGFEDLV